MEESGQRVVPQVDRHREEVGQNLVIMPDSSLIPKQPVAVPGCFNLHYYLMWWRLSSPIGTVVAHPRLRRKVSPFLEASHWLLKTCTAYSANTPVCLFQFKLGLSP